MVLTRHFVFIFVETAQECRRGVGSGRRRSWNGHEARLRPGPVRPGPVGDDMTEYLITFNDEWVPDHTEQQLREKAAAARVVLDEMRAADVVLFTNGGLDRSTAICSVESVDGKPLFTDGPYVETKEHLGGFAVVDVPDDEAARYWAGRLAVALDWPQEVHRFRTAGHPRRS